MKILVDADACPGRDIIENTARRYNIDLVMYCDINHILKSDFGEIKYVDSGFQSVDMALINDTSEGDIVVTQDYGVAAMALGKRAYAISPKGYIYDEQNIERLLFERHIAGKIRRGGGKAGNPKKRNADDDDRLKKNLVKIIETELGRRNGNE